MLLRTIARPLLGTAFITSGIDAVWAPTTPAQVAEPLLESTPLEAETVVRVAGAVQIGAGVALAMGRAPRIASTVLAATLIPTTVFASDFWNETDPVAKRMKRSAFVKNLGLLGGVMIASADTEGKPSLGWRGRRRLTEAGAAVHVVGAALPGHTKAGHKNEADDARNGLAERASHTAHELASHVPVDDIRTAFVDIAETTRAKVAERAPEAAAEARDVAAAAGEKTAAQARRWRRQLAG